MSNEQGKACSQGEGSTSLFEPPKHNKNAFMFQSKEKLN